MNAGQFNGLVLVSPEQDWVCAECFPVLGNRLCDVHRSAVSHMVAS